MEGSKRYRAQIDKKVKSLQKFEEGERVAIRNYPLKGTVSFVSAQVPITDMNKTVILYNVKLDNGKLLTFYETDLVKIDGHEKVNFT